MKTNALIPREMPRVFKASKAFNHVYPCVMAKPKKDNVYKNIRNTIAIIVIL